MNQVVDSSDRAREGLPPLLREDGKPGKISVGNDSLMSAALRNCETCSATSGPVEPSISPPRRSGRCLSVLDHVKENRADTLGTNAAVEEISSRSCARERNEFRADLPQIVAVGFQCGLVLHRSGFAFQIDLDDIQSEQEGKGPIRPSGKRASRRMKGSPD